MITTSAELAQTRSMSDELHMATPSHQLAGKVVIVTGSVGNLGLATAQELQKVGAKTVLVDRSNERLQEHYPDLINSPDHFLAGDVDLADPDSLAKTVQTALAR